MAPVLSNHADLRPRDDYKKGRNFGLEGRTRKRPKNWKDIYIFIYRIPNQPV